MKMWFGIWRALRKSPVEFPGLMYALISLVGDNPQNPSIKCQDQLNILETISLVGDNLIG